MSMMEKGRVQTKPRSQLQRCLVPIHQWFPAILTVGSLKIPFSKILSISFRSQTESLFYVVYIWLYMLSVVITIRPLFGPYLNY